MRVLLMTLVVIGCLGALASVAAQTDPLIEEMVAAVSKDRLTNDVQVLQDFVTRHTLSQGNTDAGDWLHDYFASLGIEVERHQFTYGSYTEDNIIARIPGTTAPDEIVAISGHFDSTSEQPLVLAPGADDDASAIASVLEAALVFSNYTFDRTVEFMCYNAEEQGRLGSRAIAADYLAAGKNLVAVINSDMIGYWPTAWQRDLDVAYEPVSEWLADEVIAANENYVGIPIAKHPSGVCRDDHVSFTNLGFSAVTNMDCWEAHNGGGETTPHYHRTSDTIETLNLDCMTQVAQVNVAALAGLAGPREQSGVRGLDTGSVLMFSAHPNPFRSTSQITFSLPSSGHVNLRVYDASGRLVRTLVAAHQPSGLRTVVWDGTNQAGAPVSVGLYFCRLLWEGWSRTTRVVLTR